MNNGAKNDDKDKPTITKRIIVGSTILAIIMSSMIIIGEVTNK